MPSPPEEGNWPVSDDETCAMMLSGNPTYCEQPWECEPCSIPAPPPVNAPVGQCSDNIDNDDDDQVDFEGDPYCLHQTGCDPFANDDVPSHNHEWEQGRNYILLGDMSFCAWHSHEWQTSLYTRVQAIRGAFNDPTQESESYNARVDNSGRAAMRWGASKCWGNAEMTAARNELNGATFQECIVDGECGPLTDVYPYAGLGNPRYSGAYQARAEDDIEHATLLDGANDGLDVPIDIALVIVRMWWRFNGDSDPLVTWGGQEVSTAKGAVLTNDAYLGTVDSDGPLKPLTNAAVHELGHLYGCVHDCSSAIGSYANAMFSPSECGSQSPGLEGANRFAQGCLATIEPLLDDAPSSRRFGVE